MDTGVSKFEFNQNGQLDLTAKACPPFRDAMKFGYIQMSWTDFFVDTTGASSQFYWASQPAPIAVRGESGSIPTSEAMHGDNLTFHAPWIPKTPKNYSILFTSPLNRLDLPFRVSSGIVDSDLFFHSPMGAVPVWFERGFKGIIPVGTPLFQMIPVKRDSWRSTNESFNQEDTDTRTMMIVKRFTGTYQKLFWQPKKFS